MCVDARLAGPGRTRFGRSANRRNRRTPGWSANDREPRSAPIRNRRIRCRCRLDAGRRRPERHATFPQPLSHPNDRVRFKALMREVAVKAYGDSQSGECVHANQQSQIDPAEAPAPQGNHREGESHEGKHHRDYRPDAGRAGIRLVVRGKCQFRRGGLVHERCFQNGLETWSAKPRRFVWVSIDPAAQCLSIAIIGRKRPDTSLHLDSHALSEPVPRVCLPK